MIILSLLLFSLFPLKKQIFKKRKYNHHRHVVSSSLLSAIQVSLDGDRRDIKKSIKSIQLSPR